MSIQQAVAQPDFAQDGRRSEYKFGYNVDIDTGTVPEDIWDGGGLYNWIPVTGPFGTALQSTSLLDTGAGVGMQQVRIVGVDINYQEVSDTVTLNGILPVPSFVPFFRINRMFGVAAGTTGWNVGTVQASIGGVNVSLISPTQGQTLQTCYTVPDYPDIESVYFRSFQASVGRQAATQATVVLYTRDPLSGCWRNRLIHDLNAQGSSFLHAPIARGTAFEITPGADMRVTCILTTTNNSSVGASFQLDFVPS